MSRFPSALILFALPLFPACHGAAPTVQSDVSAQAENGIPKFGRIEDALAHVVEEENLLAYNGMVWGSEHFPIELPSGAKTDNWTVNCYFRDVFGPFGDSAHRDLAPLLTHEHLFVQVGAFSVLNQYMTANGLKFHLDQTPEERAKVQKQLIALLESGR